jgi:hypothetical protein
MQCLACGIEMQFVRLIVDQAELLPACAQQIFKCPACNDVDQRLIFRTELPEPAPVEALPSEPPPEVDRDHQSTWTRALNRLYSKQAALKEQDTVERNVARLQDFNRAWGHFVPLEPNRPPSRVHRNRSKNKSVAPKKLDAQPTLEQLVTRLRTRKIVELHDKNSVRFDSPAGTGGASSQTQT